MAIQQQDSNQTQKPTTSTSNKPSGSIKMGKKKPVNELTTLLPTIDPDALEKELESDEPIHYIRPADVDEPEPHAYDEFVALMKLSYPICLTYILEYLPGVVCVILVGHINSPETKAYVAAATLSTMITNLTGLSIAIGFLSALDTLFSQAYGAGRFMKLGIYVQSSALIVGSMMIPIFLVNWHTERILLWVGQDAEVARLAGEFSRFTMIGIPFLCIYEVLRKLLQTQHITHPFIFVTILGNSVNIFGGYYLTYMTPLGFHGAALSRALGYAVLPLSILPYIWWTQNYKVWWPGWNMKEAVDHVRIFLRLGIPGMATTAMNWWAYELLSVMAGWLPHSVLSVSAHAVVMNVAAQTYMIFVGIAVASNIRVGRCLGANLPKKARMISLIGVWTAFAISCLIAAGVFLFRFQIPHIFLHDPDSVAYAAHVLLVFVPYEFVDGANGVVQGIYRGIGQQAMSARVIILAFYCIGLPLAALLSFTCKLGVDGLWIGFGSGNLTVLLICGSLLFRSSWQKLADDAKERTK